MRAMDIITNISPLPHWSSTSDVVVATKVATMVMGELQVAVLMVPLLVVLNRGEVTLLHPMIMGCMEEKLAGEAMASAGSPQITGNELHMVVMTCTMKSSQITTMCMLRWWMMRHIPRLIVVLFLVTMVVPIMVD